VGTDPSANWKLLAPEKVGTLSDIGPFDPKDGLDRFQRGDVCYLAFLGDRLAHYAWVQRSGSHPVTVAGVSVPIGSGEFWIYHCRTVDWAKGKRIYPATLQRIVNGHFAEGYATAWIYTSRENIASQKGILRAGFIQVSTLSALRVGRRHFRLGRADRHTSSDHGSCFVPVEKEPHSAAGRPSPWSLRQFPNQTLGIRLPSLS
jgi:hypothetical protein